MTWALGNQIAFMIVAESHGDLSHRLPTSKNGKASRESKSLYLPSPFLPGNLVSIASACHTRIASQQPSEYAPAPKSSHPLQAMFVHS